MAQYVETPTRSDIAAGALGQYLRVKTPGALALAGASDVSIGTMENPCLAAGACTVRLANAQGTRLMVASGAITAGNPVYAAAGGKVASSGTVVEGRAMSASTADGDYIEVMPIPNTDLSASIASTNAAAFEVDADASTPKIALSGQSGGTGDFTTTLKPESTLSGDNAIIVPEADGDTLVAVALAQTLTSKTLTSPVITQPGSNFPVYVPHGVHAASVAAAGAIPITNFYSTLDSNAGATTATLANGAVKGQLKKIKLIVDGGDVVVTPANLANGTTITFADVGDTALLVFDGTDWVVIELSNDADGVTAPVLA